MTPEKTLEPVVVEAVPPATVPIECPAVPIFGRHFVPGMLVATWREGRGWDNPRLVARGPLEVDPGAVVFHYGQAVFEGMKAYRQPDGRFAIWRLGDHARRFARSAERMAMAPVPPELFAASLSSFVAHQAGAVPDRAGLTLYIRPLLIGTEGILGIRASKELTFVIMGCVVAPYFDLGGASGIRAEVVEDFVRSSHGGTGSIKAAGNYGRGLLALRRAHENGCEQVIWLDAERRAFVEEMEGMNFFCVREGALTTPPASDTILAGFTRDSLLKLAKDLEIPTREERLPIDDLLAGVDDGRVTEAFAAGTAVVISPLAEIRRHGRVYKLPAERPIADRLVRALSDCQSGRSPDRNGWRTLV